MLRACSVVSDSVTPRSVVRQALRFMGFSRQEYWNGLPFPSPGDVPDPGIKPGSPALQVDSLSSEPPGKPKESPGSFKKQAIEHDISRGHLIVKCILLYLKVHMDLVTEDYLMRQPLSRR